MGCCQSSRRKQVSNHEVCPCIVNTKSLESDREPVSGIQSFASSAGWIADTTHGDYVRLSLDGTRLFACLFDAHFTHEAAAFCAAHCRETFFAHLANGATDPRRAIDQTFRDLDRKFLKSNLPIETRAISGCSGVIVYLDFSASKGWIGNIGTTNSLIAVTEGAFNAQNTEAREISEVHSLENASEVEFLEGRFVNDKNARKTSESTSKLTEITRVSRGIGFGFAKDPQFTRVYNQTAKRRLSPLADLKNPYIRCEPQVKEIGIPANADSLVLYSEGLGQLLSPSEIAIFTTVFNNRCLKQLAEITTEVDQSKGVPAATISVHLTESLKAPSSILTQYAVSKAADKVDKLMRSKHKTRDKSSHKAKSKDGWNVEQIRGLSVKDPSIGDHSSMTRGDLMRNLSCVVISFEKQCSRRPNSLIPSSQSTKPKVQHGWKLLQSYTKFHIQRRRACLRRWWRLIADVVRDAQKRILKAEQDQWKNEVIGTFPGSNGQSFGAFDDSPVAAQNPIASFPCTISSGFRKWLSSPDFARIDLGEHDRFSSNRALIL